ncbi:MAG: ABC transporter permease, partial [Spirochaetia bacterium]|nr:ABC transporter permease [Spirochaetia bacterium]
MITRILAVAWKEYIHIRRDFRTLYLALVMPVIMILLFGYAIDFDVDHISTGVCDLDRSAESREFVGRLTSGHWFQVRLQTQDPAQLEEALKDGRIKVGLVFREGFARAIKRKETAHIGAIIDGSD